MRELGLEFDAWLRARNEPPTGAASCSAQHRSQVKLKLTRAVLIIELKDKGRNSPDDGSSSTITVHKKETRNNDTMTTTQNAKHVSPQQKMTAALRALGEEAGDGALLQGAQGRWPVSGAPLRSGAPLGQNGHGLSHSSCLPGLWAWGFGFRA